MAPFSPDRDPVAWQQHLFWLVVIHLTFVVSALLMAVIDRLAFAEHRRTH